MMSKISFLFLSLLFMACQSVNSEKEQNSAQSFIEKSTPLPDCEWCGAAEAPKNLSSTTTIAPEDEPGDPIKISGTIFLEDGATPASDVLMYVYHTNKEGIYPKRGNEQGNAQRHGYIRAWLKTGTDGRYEFTSIKPEAYPSRNEPAHIHVTLSRADYPEFWLESYLFEGDPLIEEKHRKESERTGGFSNIIELEQDEDGVWIGERNFVLKRF